MTSWTRLLTAACALAAAALPPLAHADDPPTYYRELQAKAPEVLEIQFTAVRLEALNQGIPGDNLGSPFGQAVKATAKVLKVKRTATGLKPGDTIQIWYDSTPPRRGTTTPPAIPVFKEGAVRPAWLSAQGSGSDRIYQPAALAYSFAPVPNELPAGLDGQ